MFAKFTLQRDLTLETARALMRLEVSSRRAVAGRPVAGCCSPDSVSTPDTAAWSSAGRAALLSAF